MGMMIIVSAKTLFFFYSLASAASMLPPKIKSFSFNPDSVEGQREQVFCTVSQGHPPITFTWLKDGSILDNSPGRTIEQLGLFASSLTLTALSADDIGNYSCRTANLDGLDSHTASLLVKASAIFVKDPMDVSGTENSNLALDCLVKGHPKPTITWSKNNDGLSRHPLSENSVRPHFYPNGTLLFRRLSKMDAGHYTCHATNGVGTPIEKTIVLSVHSAPRITNITSKQTIPSGHVATIECDIVGDPPLEVAWKKGALEMMEGERYELRERPTEDGLLAEMNIINLGRADSGIYSCGVENSYGLDAAKTILKVVETPESPKEVKVMDVWSRSVQVTWSSPDDGGSPLIQQVLQFWKDIDGIPHRLEERTVSPSEFTHLLNGLEPGIEYALRVITESEVGRGQPSFTVKFHTEEEAPSGPPTDLLVIAKGTNSITVTWNAPPRENWNGVIRGYYAGIKSDASTERHAFFTVSPRTDSPIQHTFRQLKQATRYSVVVRAFNEAGTGPITHQLQAETRDTGLAKPEQFYISNSDAYSITLKWKNSIQDKMETKFYVVVYWREFESQHWSEYRVAEGEEGYTLCNLDPSTKYQTYLIARASDTDLISEPTQTLTVVTDDLGEQSRESDAFSEDTLPKLIRLEVLIPVLTSIVVITTVIVLACAYVARSKARYVAMADAQYIGAYEVGRMSSFYPTKSLPIRNPPSDETSYDAPWDLTSISRS